MAVIAARLPGITFETRNPPVTTPLPRMDIAGFVGFAASGPIDVPVAVEDIPRFHDVFGEDIALALDQNAGGLAFAELPPAVRAFFRNGGVRCWVVRVAGPGAAVNRFLIPGLLTGPADKGDVGGALALARSAGSWSDALMVNATLTQRPLPVSAISPPGAGPFRVTGLSEGDLIRLEYPDFQIVAFQPVPASDDRPPLAVAVPSADAYWFRRVARADVDMAFGSPPDPIAWLPAPVNIRWLAGAVPPDFDPDLPIARWGVRDEGFIVELDRLALGGIQPGSWLHVTVTTAPTPAKPMLVLLVESVQAAMPDSPPASGEPVWLTAKQAWWILDAAAAQLKVAAATPQASVVTFELWARDPVEATRRLADLGCAAPTPLYWGDVPDDDLVFRRDDRRPSRLDQIAPLLLNRVVIPRYPLAAPRARDAKQLPVFLPLAITALPRDEFYQPALPIAGDRLTRDGLAAFETPLFIDRDLADVTSTNLMTEAFQIQYVDPAAGSTRAVGRDLTGLHALLPIDEVSMIAVPDAIQRAWSPDPTTMLPLTAPTLVAVLADANTVHVEWQPLAPPAPIDEEQLSYMAQASLDPQFDRVASSWPVDGTTLDHPASLFPFCTAAFYRVRAMSSIRGTGPWSNTRWVELPSSAFAPNPDDRPPAPEPLAVSETRGRLRAEWTYAAGVDAAFTLERAVDPEFVSAAVVYSGPAASCEVLPGAQPPVYFREVLRGAEPIVYFRVAAAVGGHQSPWSATAITGVLNQAAAVTQSTDDYDDRALLDIDKALIRMCAGRGDAHAILGLPSHFRTDAASDLLTRLSHDLDREDGLKALSYAAVFHPWIVVRETAGRADLSTWPMVPDGSVCGTIAARTLRNGAWYSVANQFFEGALALQPVLDDSTLQLLATRINPIVQQPRGFAAVDAMTLYPDGELGDLHVRRLLILLRRLALREGNGFVFANNDDSLRRLVQREFEQVLGDLFVHGAFAGTTHDEGYQVVTGSSVNTPGSIDAGRFIVELRVAPSQPLTFLTVRLIQDGGAVVAEEL